MSGSVNDNETAVIWASRVGPRDETAPGAEVIGMEVEAPLTDERLAVALQTLDNGLSVLVIGASQKEASDTAWEIIKAMAPAVAR